MLIKVIESVVDLTMDEFQRLHVVPEKPVIVRGAAAHWAAVERWTPHYLATVGRNIVVEVKSKSDYGDSGSKRHFETSKKLQLSEVAALMTERNAPDLSYARQDVSWASCSELVRAVQPLSFWPASIQVEEGNLWLGPEGTIAQLHWDPAHNLFAQIRGEKRWVLLSPEESHLTYPNRFSIRATVQQYMHLPNLQSIRRKLDAATVIEGFVDSLTAVEQDIVFAFLAAMNNCDVNVEEPDWNRTPLFKNATRLEAVLKPGDVIFVPQFWRHYVRSLSPSISLNWFFSSDASVAMFANRKNMLLQHLSL